MHFPPEYAIIVARIKGCTVILVTGFHRRLQILEPMQGNLINPPSVIILIGTIIITNLLDWPVNYAETV